MTADATGSLHVTGDRRARHREARRDRLYHAAVELFVEKGFDNTKMEEIAERADTARATVFNHFQRKTAFLDEWSLRRRRRAMHAIELEHLEDRPLRDILARYLTELARISADSRAETVACMGAAIRFTNVFGNPELAHQFEGFVARAQKAGEVRPGTDPEHAALLLASSYFATLSAWIGEEPAPFDLERRLLETLAMILDGILGR
ncbi:MULTISPECIES: TetR/AcrR family transcriptional regulator [Amycolatopsis]|uniref:DNA-binding transcriptional regulator, AcrR family n=2 Tax=Amycolatopsis TaxID=1813 RepID=A0A1I3WL52_9PSEU|nr:TetR/AcrR family transcriptional regulator [Amycolatopsis sacchari]SFK07919.1 DNA-binding transcriptional regulator, AcrR family [Amycolatopsis sacchari]